MTPVPARAAATMPSIAARTRLKESPIRVRESRWGSIADSFLRAGPMANRSAAITGPRFEGKSSTVDTRRLKRSFVAAVEWEGDALPLLRIPLRHAPPDPDHAGAAQALPAAGPPDGRRRRGSAALDEVPPGPRHDRPRHRPGGVPQGAAEERNGRGPR